MSRFWDELAEQHKRELQDGAGYREIARRYITNPVHDNDSSIREMAEYLVKNGVGILPEPDGRSNWVRVFPDSGIGGTSVSYDSLQTSAELDRIYWFYRNFCREEWTASVDVCEIGSGYGRTAYGVLCIWTVVDRYTIVDIEPAKSLSRDFLTRMGVIDRVRYSPVVPPGTDLVISISLFDELTPPEITRYMEQISTHSRYFYCKYQYPWFNEVDQVTVDVGELISGYGETLYAGDCLLNPWLPRPMREVVMRMGNSNREKGDRDDRT